MLAKDSKLKKSEEVKAVLKEGRRVRGQFLSVFFLPQPEARFRAAVVVGKKVAETAVKRNRIRRVVFAYLGEHLPSLGEKAVGGMVILLGKLPEDEKVVTAELEKCLKELSLI